MENKRQKDTQRKRVESREEEEEERKCVIKEKGGNIVDI